MRSSERVTITLPMDLARRLREASVQRGAGSVSAFVRQLVEDRLEEENLAAFLAELQARGGASTDESRQWAQRVVDTVDAAGRSREVA